jgi:ribosomal protein S18 acetylase RimI-like enzyme
MNADYESHVTAQRAVVVEIAGGIRGYMIGWPEGDTYFIENVGVDPHYQGHGLGRRLIEHAVTEARRHRLQELSLYTNEAMTENLAMYAHLGFVETHRVTELGFRRVYMRRALANSDA